MDRQRAEQLQRALFVIAQLATADISEDAFYRSIHGVVGELLNARNFFIALLSQDRQQLEFPFYVDDLDRIAPSRPLGRGLSEYVLRHAQPLLGDTAFVMQLSAQGEIEVASAGPPAVCWLGVPLMSGDEAVGLIAVQSYDPQVVYGPADQELLGFVASQIANSLNRRHAALIQQRAFEMLEERVQLRTHELRAEISERERIEDRLKHEVMHDALTNLPNRGYLRSRLNRVLSRTGCCRERWASQTDSVRCCIWISTGSRSSTTASATRRATRCSRRSPSACKAACVTRILSHGFQATSS